MENEIDILQERRLSKLIDAIVEEKRKYHLSPEANRYALVGMPDETLYETEKKEIKV